MYIMYSLERKILTIHNPGNPQHNSEFKKWRISGKCNNIYTLYIIIYIHSENFRKIAIFSTLYVYFPFRIMYTPYYIS